MREMRATGVARVVLRVLGFFVLGFVWSLDGPLGTLPSSRGSCGEWTALELRDPAIARTLVCLLLLGGCLH